MQENMSISVNGQSQVPPGFRFHPTEEELLQYYLRKKVCYEKIDLDVIREVNLNKLEPWDIQEKCKIGTTPQNDWYFFSHKDKKYPTGTRTNRATEAGFWKATGRDKVIYGNGKRIGMRKTLVFYKGRAPNGQKSDWIMHEYRLEDNNTTTETSIVTKVMVDGVQEEGWVVCRIYKKKNHLKTLESPLASSITGATRRSQHHDRLFDTCDDDEGALEQILEQMGRSCCKEQIHPILGGSFGGGDPNFVHYQMEAASSSLNGGLITNWAALDQLVASQLNGQTEASSHLACFNTTLDPSMCYCSSDRDHLQLPNLRSSSSNATQDHYTSAIDPPWNFAPSTSSLFASLEPLCHVSNASSSVAKNVPKSDNNNNNNR